jgi:hypothetical protein
MKRLWYLLVVLMSVGGAIAAPPLFTGSTESKWSVTRGGGPAGSVTLLTNGSAAVRAEYKSASNAPAVIFLGSKGKVWVRASGGDVELSAYNGAPEKSLVPALLLPFTTTSADRTQTKSGKTSQYTYGGSKASYDYDSKGPAAVTVTASGSTWTLTRTSFAEKAADASLFTVRPKSTAASRLARLSGDLLGPSDNSVSATAGGRGVSGSGLKFADGGDYAALEKLENRDAKWKEKLDEALAEFQKDGKVGKERGAQ